jgi:hypothetical protein
MSNHQVVGSALLFAGRCVLSEIVSGALKEAGKELWTWARDTGSRRHRRKREGQ